MAYADEIRSALRTGWHRPALELTPLAPRVGERAWRVETDRCRCVAVLVPAAGRSRFEAGLAAIEHLRLRGLAVAAPVRCADGALTLGVGDGVLAVLAEVPGRALVAADPLDQQWWGDLLGTVHRELTAFNHPGLMRWHWVRPDAAHLDLEPWLRPAVAEAVAALAKLAITDQLTYGVLHGDPVAGVFRIDVTTGRTGLTGWGPAATGPLVYDVAAAVIDAGGPGAATELLDGYLAAGPVTREELEAALPVLLRFRWAEEADRCARELAVRMRDAGAGAEPDELAAERELLGAARDALTAR